MRRRSCATRAWRARESAPASEAASCRSRSPWRTRRTSHTGTVDFLDNQVDRGSGTIAVRAVLDNKDRVFTPGLYTRVRLVGSGEFSAVLIDDKAVLTDHDRNYVYIVDKDGLAQRRDVKLGGSSHWLRIVRGAGGGRPRDRQRRAEGVLAGHACAGHGGAHGGCCGARVRHQMKHHAGARHRSDVSHNERRGALPLTPFKVLAHGPLQFFMDRPIFAAVLSIVIFVSACSRSRRCRSANIPRSWCAPCIRAPTPR